jgi:hypothetical protein
MTRFARFARNALAPIAAAVLAASVAGPGLAAGVAASPPTDLVAESGAPAAPGGGAASAAPAVNPAPPRPENLEPLAARDYSGVLGKKIIGPDGKELGLLVDVLVDGQGRPVAAIVDFGGFLGVGSRKIAVDWRLLKLSPGQPDWKISLNLGRAEIQGVPEYSPGAVSDKMVGPPPEASPSRDNGK